MKFTEFRNLVEDTPRNVPLEKTTPTEQQKALAKRDVDKRQALKTVTGKDFAAAARDIGTAEVDQDELEATRKAGQEFAATTKLNPVSGRTVANDRVGQIKRANPTATDAQRREIAAQQAADEEEAERIKILAMPDGPERKKALGDNMRKRMSKAADMAAPGSLNTSVATNTMLDKEFRQGEGENAIEPFETGVGTKVASQSGSVHNLQPDYDMGYAEVDPREFPNPATKTQWTNPEDGRSYHYNNTTNEWNPAIDRDEVDTIVGLNMDPADNEIRFTRDPETGEVVAKATQANVGWGANPQSRMATAAQLDYWNNDERGAELLQAIDDGDNDKVQQMAFTHYAGEEGEKHESVDQFIKRTDIRTAGAPNMKGLAGAGLDAARLEAVYGGTLDPELQEIADEFQVEGAPPGVYNVAAMKKSKKNAALIKKAMAQIEKNREYEVVRTYLKQGAKDGYYPNEGIRSIENMNLEHIRSLNAPEGSNGYDHPSNWVWISETTNKIKNARTLGDEISKFDEPKQETGASGSGADYGAFKKNMIRALGTNVNKFNAALKHIIPELSMNQQTYGTLEQSQVDDARDRLRRIAQDAGVRITPEQIDNFLPDIQTRPGFKSDGFDPFDTERKRRETERMEDDTTIRQIGLATGNTSDLRYRGWDPDSRREVENALKELDRRRKGIPSPDGPVDDVEPDLSFA